MTERYDDALRYAHELHRDQTRKDRSTPYIAHLLAVSALVIEAGGTEDQAIAALLHDAAEDQGGEATLGAIHRRFGPAVAAMVADCSDTLEQNKSDWWPRKRAYIDSLAGKQEASLLVSLADKTHNAESIRMDRDRVGETVWDRFAVGRDGTRWYYRQLADFFARRLPGPLSVRLTRAVRAIGA